MITAAPAGARIAYIASPLEDIVNFHWATTGVVVIAEVPERIMYLECSDPEPDPRSGGTSGSPTIIDSLWNRPPGGQYNEEQEIPSAEFSGMTLATTADMNQDFTLSDLASTAGLEEGDVYIATGGGIPANTKFTYNGSGAGTLDKATTQTAIAAPVTLVKAYQFFFPFEPANRNVMRQFAIEYDTGDPGGGYVYAAGGATYSATGVDVITFGAATHQQAWDAITTPETEYAFLAAYNDAGGPPLDYHGSPLDGPVDTLGLFTGTITVATGRMCIYQVIVGHGVNVASYIINFGDQLTEVSITQLAAVPNPDDDLPPGYVSPASSSAPSWYRDPPTPGTVLRAYAAGTKLVFRDRPFTFHHYDGSSTVQDPPYVDVVGVDAATGLPADLLWTASVPPNSPAAGADTVLRRFNAQGLI